MAARAIEARKLMRNSESGRGVQRRVEHRDREESEYLGWQRGEEEVDEWKRG